MPKPGKEEFVLVKKCRKLYQDICETQARADKNYRYTVCADLRGKCADLTHLVRKANAIEAGDPERIKLQEEAIELLERIKDLVPVVGALVKMGVNYEAQIELSVDNIRIPLQNWMNSDAKALVKHRLIRMRKSGWDVYYADEDLKLIEKYKKDHPNDEKAGIALDEAKALKRNRLKEYQKRVLEFDEAVSTLSSTTHDNTKKETIMESMLKQLRGPRIKHQPDDNEVKARNLALKECNQAFDLSKLNQRTVNEITAAV